MTIQELFNYTEAQYPCQYPANIKLVWLNQLEKDIADFLWMYDKDTEFEEHTETTEELLIDEPDIYALYIGLRADFCNGEYGRYNNKLLFFNSLFDEWKAKYGRHHEGDFGERYIKI